MEARIAHDHRVLGPVADQRQRGDGRVAVPAVPGDAGHAVLHVVYGQVRATGDGADALAEGSVRVDGQGEVGHIGRAFGQRRRRQQRHQRQSQRQQALPASHLHVGVPLLCGKYFRSMTKFGTILHILSHLKYIVNSKREFVTYFPRRGRKKEDIFLHGNAPHSRLRRKVRRNRRSRKRCSPLERNGVTARTFAVRAAASQSACRARSATSNRSNSAFALL